MRREKAAEIVDLMADDWPKDEDFGYILWSELEARLSAS